MGCGGSKKSKKDKVDMTMDPSGNDAIDALFTDMIGPLTTLADISNSLKKADNRLSRRTHAYLLTQCTLDDSVFAFLVGLSASTNADFDKIELKIETESPYIKISKQKVEPHMHEVVDAWNYLIEKLIEAGKSLVDLPGQIQDLVVASKDLTNRAKDICTSANMSIIETAKAIKVVALNAAKITKAPAVLTNTKECLEQLVCLLKYLHAKLDHEGREKIHTIGKQIHKDKVTNLRDMVVNYWPDKTRIDLKVERPRKGKAGNS